MSLQAIFVATVVIAVIGVPLAEFVTRWAERDE